MFSLAKCGHCGHMGTKLHEIEPSGSAYKLQAVCCQSCNSILGVVDFFNVGTLLKNAEKEQKKLAAQAQSIDSRLAQIERLLKR